MNDTKKDKTKTIRVFIPENASPIEKQDLFERASEFDGKVEFFSDGGDDYLDRVRLRYQEGVF